MEKWRKINWWNFDILGFFAIHIFEIAWTAVTSYNFECLADPHHLLDLNLPNLYLYLKHKVWVMEISR